jgi:hypothetical protein
VDLRTLILLAISCLMLILLVRTLVRPASRPARVRTVVEPEGEGWLGLEELAAQLDTRPAEILALVERDAIPFWVRPGSGRDDPRSYWFRRDEIDAWTIG